MTRLEANRKIIETLAAAVEKYPDQRFVQLLSNSDVIVPEHDATGFHVIGYKDNYGEESVDILNRVLQSVVMRTP